MNKGFYNIPKNRTYEAPTSASYSQTASYIDPNFISASAASAGFGSGTGNASTIDVYSFGYDVDSYPLFSNVIGTTGVSIGGDTELRYNAATNKLIVGNILTTTITGSLSGSVIGYLENSQTASFITNSQTSSFIKNNQTSSFITNSQTSSFVTNSQTSSFITNSQTSSFITNSQTSSFVTNSQTSSFVTNSQTSSFVTNSQTSSFVRNTQTGSFAILSSDNLFSAGNTFSGQIRSISTLSPANFTDAAAIYTDGGLRVTKDAYISGSLYVNNLNVIGTSSILNITSSQLNIATNLITVNTATPSVRFGGIAVYDSGSTGTGLTGSLLWDSQNDVWIYSNPSGAAYDGAMMLVGPRNTSGIGNEVGITTNYLAKGDGSHHMTSSQISDDGTKVTIPGNLLVNGWITGSISGSVVGYVPNSTTSSFITNSQTSSFVTNSQTSSFVTNSQTSSFVNNSQTSSMLSPYAPNSQTSSFIRNSQTSSMNVATASWSSFPINVVGSTIYSTSPLSSNTPNITGNIFLGSTAGDFATSAFFSVFLGQAAGTSASYAYGSNFIGTNTGFGAANANSSNFIGSSAGNAATNADNSNFIGNNAGNAALSSSNSNFIGNGSGYFAISASYCTLIGYQTGYNSKGNGFGIGRNNIVIGTNITLPDNSQNYINIGAIIFASGSYFSTASANPYSGSVNGRVGINQPLPQYTLDVSGSGNFTNGFIVSGSGVTQPFQISNGSTNLLFVSSSGRVGIGTSTPTAQLNVVGDTTIRATSGTTTLSIGGSQGAAQNVDGNLSIISSLSNNLTLQTFRANSPLISSAASNNLRFGVNGGVVSMVMFSGTRNVLIQDGGTATDNGFRLDVSGSTRLNGTTTITGSTTIASGNSLTVASGSITITTGSITMPNRPAFRVTGAGGGKSSTTVLSGSYLNVDYQQGGGWDNTTGTFTAPIAGLYQVNLVVRTNSNSLGTISQLIVYKNNTTISPGPDGTPQVMVEFGANTTMNHAGGSTISKLAVGDTLKMIVAAGQISFDGNDNFSVAYIG